MFSPLPSRRGCAEGLMAGAAEGDGQPVAVGRPQLPKGAFKKLAAARAAAAAAAEAEERAKPPSRPKKKKELSEALMEMTPYEKCAIALNEAIHSRCYIEYPGQKVAWYAYVAHQKTDGLLQMSVLGLLLLTVFETPLWCNSSGAWHWDWQPAEERCSASSSMPRDEIIMSGVIMLPTGIGAIVEYSLLIAILVRVTLIWRVESAFKDCGSARGTKQVIGDYVLIALGLVDACVYWANPATSFRIAPYVRFGLAASIPWVRDLLHSFWRVAKAIVKVFLFLMGTVVIFAWVAAMVFDDLVGKDRYGDPINQGFESFGSALYTSFATMTTAVTPDAMIPSYVWSRSFVLMWIPFLVLATVIFNNVLLATVYSEYQAHTTSRVKADLAQRNYSLKAAFEMIKERSLEGDFHVRFETFVQVATMLRTFHPISVDEKLLRLIYQALDENNDGTLDSSEFEVMCDILQTEFTITRRDGWFRMHYGDTCLGRGLRRIIDKSAEGTDFGYNERFQGSVFDKFMNFVLAMNVVWVVFQSVIDLNNMEEPGFFQAIDVFFSFIYLLEVGLKLCYWSWGEYWQNNDNRFDFVSTMVLAASAFGYLFFKVDRNILRYLNLLRLVRLLKALNNISAYREVWSVIERMVRTCSDVLAMNFLVIYLWSAAGVQLFGGQLCESNARLAGQDLAYFSSHYQVYNFNDMFMGMITLYYFTLGTWIDPIACACMELADKFTFQWFLNYGFLLTFYVGSPLLAFNVFTSFSIDVFCNLQAMDKAGDAADKVKQNLAGIQTKMAEEGYCLHVQESAELSRARVFRKMFADA